MMPQMRLRGVPEESQRGPNGCAKPDGVVDFWRHTTWVSFCNGGTFPEANPHAEVVFGHFVSILCHGIATSRRNLSTKKRRNFPRIFQRSSQFCVNPSHFVASC